MKNLQIETHRCPHSVRKGPNHEGAWVRAGLAGLPLSSISGPTASGGSMTDTPPRRLLLWGVGTSRTLRAHWSLHELGLDYKSRPILPRSGETKTQEYTRLNPRQKIPLLQDGDFKIAESPAIAAYLSNTYGTPETALIPSDPREHAT